MSTNGDGAHDPRESPHDCRPDRFERNRYFHQKPMFARDFVAEQTYHVNRQNTLARYLAGEGILEGLETTVEEEDDGQLTVTVSEGVALDCCGRLLVVPDETEWTLDDPGGETHLYLLYGECVTETVPLSGSEGACETECEYNRVLEVVDVEHGSAPNFDQYKRIPEIDFPDPTTTKFDDEEALLGMAQQFHENGGTLHDCGTDDRRVFLGTFAGDGPGQWLRDDTVPLGYAYSTDLLYAVLANLLFEPNPHRIGLEVDSFTGGAGETGATLRTQGTERPDREVTVFTDNPGVEIGNSGTDRLTIDVPGLDDLQGLDERLDALEEALREQATRYVRTAFSVVAERFADTATIVSEAENVRLKAVGAINSQRPPYDTENLAQFPVFIKDVLGDAKDLKDALENADVATTESINRYDTALQDLETVHSAGDRHRMTTALDGLSEAAEWLELISAVRADLVTVFEGDREVDLTGLGIDGLQASGKDTLFGVSPTAEETVDVNDVTSVDIDMNIGDYATSKNGPAVLAVREPVITSIRLTAENGDDVTNGTVSTKTLAVTASWNFDAFEKVQVLVRDDNQKDITDEVTPENSDMILDKSGDSIRGIMIDRLDEGRTYTVAVEGTDHLGAEKSVTFSFDPDQ